MAEDPRWRRQNRRVLYESGWFNVNQDDVTLPSGDDIVYTYVDHPGYAMVLPITGEGRAVLVDVYRYPLSDTALECPAGGLDGRTPLQTVTAELEEETGYRASDFHSLGSFQGSPGCSSEVFHLFLATGATLTSPTSHEITEQIEVRLISIAELYRMARAGNVAGGPTTLCVLMAAASGHLDPWLGEIAGAG